MAPPFDTAQNAMDAMNQAIAHMGTVKENIAGLQQKIEILGNDLKTAQEETSTAQQEARSMRKEVMSARQEIQCLKSQLESEEASNKSLRQRLRDLGERFSSLQDAFRAGFDVFSTVYQRAQRLVLDSNDTRANVPEAAQNRPSTRPTETTETLISASCAPSPSGTTSPGSTLSSPYRPPTPSSSTESASETPDTNPIASISPTNAQAIDLTPTSRPVATVDCYAMIALESKNSGVPLAMQSAAHSSVVRMPAQKFGSKVWRISDGLRRNLESWGVKGLNAVCSMLLECVDTGTSGVIYESTRESSLCIL